jgi:hypothetical protein
MARIIYSALVGEMRGKLNGNVLTRNKGGAVIRNKVTPINPNTLNQAKQRAFLSLLSKFWANTLTDAQRAAWKAFGQVIGAKSIFGNNLILSGIATFQRINRIILAAGGTQISVPPNSLDVAGILTLALTANHIGPALTVAFTPTPAVAPVGMYLFATPALSPGISNASTQLRFINFYSAAVSGFSILADWQARFGAMPAVSGKRIAISVQMVNLNTGALTASITASTLII